MAEERLGASFSIDVSQLQAGLKTANKLIRESQSQFKAAAAGMDDWRKSEEGLNARNQALNSQIQVQQQKVNALKQNYQNLINQGLDPASDRAIQLRTQINNEEAALARNEKEVEDNKEALSKLGDETEDAADKTEKASGKFQKLGEIAKGAAKACAVGIAAISAGVVALSKSAVEAYADYEQLVGGVETLFGAGGMSVEEYAKSVGKSVKDVQGEYDNLISAQDTMIKNANNAYKTAGMSANQYMENVTGFSASLISSLGGDTQKAAAAADQAMTDIADNSNKMGTDMQSIVDTYQSLARGNYQMLDNLKLGYGGTKTEMERMIADANAVKKANGEMADLSIDSFADVTEAIHIIQTEMGITGTTAKEAESTISGSVGMVKASWGNLLVGIADDTQDFDQLIDNFVDSIGHAAENLIPRIATALGGIVKLVQNLMPLIPPLIEQFLPIAVQGIVDVTTGIVQMLPSVIDAIMQVIPMLLEAIVTNLPTILETITNIIVQLCGSLAEMLPTIVDAIIQIIPILSDALVSAIPQIMQAAITLLMAIVQALPTIIQALITELPKIIQTILDTVLTAYPQLVQAAITLLMGIIQALPTIIQALTKNLPKIITTIINILIQNLPLIVNAAITLLMGIIQAIPKILPELIKAIPTIITSIVKQLTSKESISSISQAGKDLIKGLWNGINDMGAWIGEKIKGFGDSVLGSLKSFFGIKSPSTVMRDQVGKNIALGLIKGVEGQKKNAKKSASELSELYVKSAKDRVSLLEKQNKITVAQEISLWEEIMKHSKKGSKGYKEAHQQLAKAEQNYRKNSLKYEKTYSDGVKKVQSELIKNIQAVVDAYDEAVSKRKENIIGQFSFFDNFSSTTKKSASGIIKNMQSQVDALTRWDSALDKLENRKGVPKALIEGLQELGVSETANIELLANMSDSELQQYVKLWKQRNGLAQDRAVQENEGLEASTQKQIRNLVKNANKDLNALEKTYMKNMSSLQTKTNDKSKSIGKNIVKGLKKGIKSENKDFQKYLTDFFNGITNTAKTSLKIHSPSQVMKEQIGKNIALGIVQGFDENIKGLNASVQSISGDLSGSVGDGMKKSSGNVNNSRSVVVNQTNNYSQAHSRYEIYKSKQQTAAAVRLAMGAV